VSYGIQNEDQRMRLMGGRGENFHIKMAYGIFNLSVYALQKRGLFLRFTDFGWHLRFWG